jgi:hypothetical protein
VAEYDKGVVNLAQLIFGEPQPKSEQPKSEQPKSEPPPAEPNVLQQAPKVTVEVPPDRADMPEGKETKTAAELAQMIEADLVKHPQCPKNGLQVTVYGTTLWRAMLTITPAAGPVRNPQEWRDLTEELAERLRKRYDLAWR